MKVITETNLYLTEKEYNIIKDTAHLFDKIWQNMPDGGSFKFDGTKYDEPTIRDLMFTLYDIADNAKIDYDENEE